MLNYANDDDYHRHHGDDDYHRHHGDDTDTSMMAMTTNVK